MREGIKRDVFISYRRSDDANNYVEQLHTKLEEKLGKDIFFDKKDLWNWSPSGFPDELKKAIENCYCFLSIISKDYLERRESVDWCEEELTHAKEKKVPVVCIVLDGATEKDGWEKIQANNGEADCRTDGRPATEHDRIVSWLKSKKAKFTVPIDTTQKSSIDDSLDEIVEMIYNTMFLGGHRSSFNDFLGNQKFTKEDVGDNRYEDIKDWITFKIKKQKTDEERKKEAEQKETDLSNIDVNAGEADMDVFLASLETEKRIVITGDAGQGKSIYLKQLCNKMTDIVLENQYNRNELFPIYAELKRIKINGDSPSDNDIVKAIAEATQNGMTKEMIGCVIRNGKPCFLFDGIDEIDPARFSLIKDLIDKNVNLTKENVRMVFTSRPGQRWLANNADVTMKSVVGKDIQDVIVRQWKLDAISDDVFEAFAEQVFNDTNCGNKQPKDATAPKFIAALKDKEKEDEKYVAISRNSFMLKMAAVFFKTQKNLPNTKIEAFNYAVNAIVDRDIEREKAPGKDIESSLADNVKQVLGKIAFELYKAKDGNDARGKFVANEAGVKGVIKGQFKRNEEKIEKVDKFFDKHKLVDQNGFAHDLFACYYCAFYIYKKLNQNQKFGLKEFAYAKENMEKDYWHSVVEMLICLIEYNANGEWQEEYQELLDTMLTSMQTEVKDPNYDLLCEAVVQFIDKDNLAMAEKNLILHMLERGERGIKTFNSDTFTCSDGANPYDELFYYVAWHDLFFGLKVIFTERSNYPLSPIQAHLFNELCEVLGLELMIPTVGIEKEYDSTFSFAASSLRCNKRGHVTTNVDSFLPWTLPFGYLPVQNIISIKIVGNSSFSGPPHGSETLKYIVVESERYYVTDDCIIDNESGEIILASSRTTNIPNSTLCIGTYAFSYCKSIKEILIPQRVENIDEKAFEYCTSIESLRVDENNKKYYSESNCIIERETETLVLGCKNSVIPNTVKSIRSGAFLGCTSLHEIAIPSSVEYIGEDAFVNCSNVEHIIVESGNAFYFSKNDCLIEKDSGTLLLGCNNSVIPMTGDIKSIGDNAFNNCTGLIEIRISKEIYSIGFGAFAGCNNLKKVSFEADSCLRIIDDCAFCGCNQLESMDIPDRVTSIIGQTFYGCSQLKNINFPKELKQIGDGAVDDTAWMREQKGEIYIDKIFYKYRESETQKQEAIVLKDNCVAISAGAFSGVFSLKSIIIPNSVEKICSGAFTNCENLQKVVFLKNSKLKEISDLAFSGCKALMTFAIPDNVEKIGDYAFEGCISLKQVYFGENSKLKEISSSAFSGTPWRENIQNGIVYYGPIASDIEGFHRVGSNIVIKTGTRAITREVLRDIDLLNIIFPNSLINVNGEDLHKTDWFNSHTNGLVYISNVVCGYNGDSAKVKTIELPNRAKGISSYAFANTHGLRNFSMEDSVEYIGENAFFNSSLENIRISDNIERICNDTFYRCIKLRSIALPKNMYHIDCFAFCSCVALERIIIYDKVKVIANRAFENCYNLKNVYYIGTEEQWNKIEIDAGNECLLKAKRYYFSEIAPIDVEKTGDFWHFAEDGKTPVIWGEGH